MIESGFSPADSDLFYLSEVSPKDKPWDVHRSESGKVQNLYSGGIFDQYAHRIAGCSGLLEFNFVVEPETGDSKLKLSAAHFCRVRHCPVCQWRRSLMWRARFFEALPKILADYPKLRFLFLTLTVRNCSVGELRKTLVHMNKSFQRLSQRRQFPALGWVKSVEVTRSIIGEAHPHLHVILAVNPGYFHHGYLSHEKWVALWRDCLRVDYDPLVNVQAVKSKVDPLQPDEQMMKAICETLKYSLKPEDLTNNREWLEAITSQLHKTRAVSLGGIFKTYISQEEPEDLIGEKQELEDSAGLPVWFNWGEQVQRYYKVPNQKNSE